MKKLLGILVLGLLWCNVSFANPITLLCINDKSGFKWKVTIDLNKKTMAMGEGLVPREIFLEGNKIIMYRPPVWTVYLDRETGAMSYHYKDMNDGQLKIEHLTCKKADKLF